MSEEKKKKLRLRQVRKLKNGDNAHVGMDLELNDKKIGNARLSFKRKSPNILEIGFNLNLNEEKPPDEN